MIKYVAVACALKMFSLSPQTKKVYRALGNRVGAKMRVQKGLPASYAKRASWILDLFEKYGIPQEGANLLELGTGWLHWESTVARLFYDANITLFDVWDNRQFDAYKAYFSDFRTVLDSEIDNLPARQAKAKALLDTIIAAESFDEVYELLGFRYVVEPSGSLQNLGYGTYDAFFSYNVFEHIDRSIISGYVNELYRLLKPGGYSFLNIDMSDHLAHYAKSVNRKNYLHYSDATWKRYFENEVQYFNRIQRSEWLKLFSQAGFELVSEDCRYQPVNDNVNVEYRHLDRKDIECTTLNIVHRKPLHTGVEDESNELSRKSADSNGMSAHNGGSGSGNSTDHVAVADNVAVLRNSNGHSTQG